MTMQAIVLAVQRDRLLVLDRENRQRVVVITREARRFRRGELVCILYGGAMTASIPPQITARRIRAIPWFGWRGRC